MTARVMRVVEYIYSPLCYSYSNIIFVSHLFYLFLQKHNQQAQPGRIMQRAYEVSF